MSSQEQTMSEKLNYTFKNAMTAKNWLGFMWMPFSGLTGTNGSGAAGTTHKSVLLTILVPLVMLLAQT